MRMIAGAALLSFMLAGGGDEHADRWRSANTRGNRYEGVGYRTPQAAPAKLALVSFLAERPAGQSLAAELTVRFYLPAPQPNVQILARELNPVREYRMEALPVQGGWTAGWNSFKGWRTADVLGPEEIPASNLGVLVGDAANVRGARIYAAVLQPSDAPPAARVERYVAHLKPSFRASGGTFSVTKGCGDAAAPRGAASGPIGSQRANVSFAVRFSLDDAAAGPITLTISLDPQPAIPSGPTTPQVAATAEPPAVVSYCFVHPGASQPDGHGRR
jgi:hypothetical protein